MLTTIYVPAFNPGIVATVMDERDGAGADTRALRAYLALAGGRPLSEVAADLTRRESRARALDALCPVGC